MNNYKIVNNLTKNELKEKIFELNDKIDKLVKINNKLKIAEEESTQILINLDTKINLLRIDLDNKNKLILELKKNKK